MQTIAVGAGQPKIAKVQSPPFFVTQKGITNNPDDAKIFKTRDEAEEAVPANKHLSFKIITSQVLASYISNGLQLPATEIINE